jgi:hypothetical protein
MISVPALSEADLGDTIEGECGVRISLISPDGTTIDQSVNGGALKGFVRHSYTDTREKSGDKVIVNAPVVKLRLTSLAQIPATGEKWRIGIPESPLAGAGIEWYDLDPKKPVEVSRGSGTVKMFLAKMRNEA